MRGCESRTRHSRQFEERMAPIRALEEPVKIETRMSVRKEVSTSHFTFNPHQRSTSMQARRQIR